MRLTCAKCGKLTIPAATVGGLAYGPVCARRAGLLQPNSRAVLVMHDKAQTAGACAVVRDDKTLDMFGVAA